MGLFDVLNKIAEIITDPSKNNVENSKFEELEERLIKSTDGNTSNEKMGNWRVTDSFDYMERFKPTEEEINRRKLEMEQQMEQRKLEMEQRKLEMEQRKLEMEQRITNNIKNNPPANRCQICGGAGGSYITKNSYGIIRRDQIVNDNTYFYEWNDCNNIECSDGYVEVRRSREDTSFRCSCGRSSLGYEICMECQSSQRQYAARQEREQSERLQQEALKQQQQTLKQQNDEKEKQRYHEEQQRARDRLAQLEMTNRNNMARAFEADRQRAFEAQRQRAFEAINKQRKRS